VEVGLKIHSESVVTRSTVAEGTFLG
jgi:hypothetical protein